MSHRSRSMSDRIKSNGAVPVGTLPAAGDYARAYVFFACRADNIPATGSILNYDGGFGVRGLRQTMGGRDLPERIASRREREGDE